MAILSTTPSRLTPSAYSVNLSRVVVAPHPQDVLPVARPLTDPEDVVRGIGWRPEERHRRLARPRRGPRCSGRSPRPTIQRPRRSRGPRGVCGRPWPSARERMTSPSERKHHLAGEVGRLERHLGQPPAVGGTAEPAVVPAAAIRMPGRIGCIEDVDSE
jgi:hypothetical protein